MSFLLWQRSGPVGIGSPRLVLRAAEVPLLNDAQQLCQALAQMRDAEEERLAAAAQAARDEGHAQGREAGDLEARETLAATLVTLAQASAAGQERLRSNVGALALQVVRKMLGQFADDAVLVALADAARAEILPAQQLTLVVHPDKCQAVRERLATATAANAPAPRYEVRSDPGCAPDDCRIDTEHGSVDISLDAQLGRLAAAWGVTQ